MPSPTRLQNVVIMINVFVRGHSLAVAYNLYQDDIKKHFAFLFYLKLKRRPRGFSLELREQSFSARMCYGTANNFYIIPFVRTNNMSMTSHFSILNNYWQRMWITYFFMYRTASVQCKQHTCQQRPTNQN